MDPPTVGAAARQGRQACARSSPRSTGARRCCRTCRRSTRPACRNSRSPTGWGWSARRGMPQRHRQTGSTANSRMRCASPEVIAALEKQAFLPNAVDAGAVRRLHQGADAVVRHAAEARRRAARLMTSALFSPFTLRDLTLANRIVISPMCEYSAVDGCATDWHVIHLGHLALSGAGLLIIEATAVERARAHQPRVPRPVLATRTRRRSRACWPSCAATARCPSASSSSHAGRKGSQRKPGDGRGNVPTAEGGWQTVGPSALPFIPEWQTPQAARSRRHGGDRRGLRARHAALRAPRAST